MRDYGSILCVTVERLVAVDDAIRHINQMRRVSDCPELADAISSASEYPIHPSKETMNF